MDIIMFNFSDNEIFISGKVLGLLGAHHTLDDHCHYGIFGVDAYEEKIFGEKVSKQQSEDMERESGQTPNTIRRRPHADRENDRRERRISSSRYDSRAGFSITLSRSGNT
jgi:hypothetical protein